MAAVKPPREMKLGSKGRDVRALKRALKSAGFWPPGERITNVFDQTTDAAVRSFQRARGLADDGEVGKNTFGALLPHYDAFGRWLVRQVRRRLRNLANPRGKRQRIVAAANVGFRNRESIHYTQGMQRMEGVREQIRLMNFPRFEDCSSFATWCYWVAGAPDPNGSNYNGTGWTGTQIQRGTRVANPRPGDLVFYGSPTINHVTIYVGNGQVVSHGSESGPNLAGIDYRPDRNHIRSYLP